MPENSVTRQSATSGPWLPSARTFRTHTHSGRSWERSIATPDGVIVATAFGSTPEEAEANAERIAALPDLIAALQALAHFADYPAVCFCDVAIGNPMVTTHTAACLKAREALAKAEATR